MPARVLEARPLVVLGLDVFVVANNFLHHEGKELFSKVGVEAGFFGERSQARNLSCFTCRVSRRKIMESFDVSDSLGTAETLSKNMDERSIDVVDGSTRVSQLGRDACSDQGLSGRVGADLRFFCHWFSHPVQAVRI